VLRIFLSAVERCLREHSPGRSESARIGAVAFIHRFGSSLNEHVRFACLGFRFAASNFPTRHFFFPFHLSLLLSDGWGKFDYRNWGLLDYH
jgi:hypothetical protein